MSRNERTQDKQTEVNKAQDKKTQIIIAAAAVLTKSGVQALSFENVAFEAGLSRQLVRYYYASVDALIVDVCDYLGAMYQQLLVTGIVDVKQVERLNFFLDFFFDLADGHPMPSFLEAYDGMVAYSVGSSELQEHMCVHYYTLGRVMAHELAIAYPELDNAACEELSFMFVSMMHAHWSFVASLGYSRQHGRLARKAFERLVQSYRDDRTFTPAMDKPWSREK